MACLCFDFNKFAYAGLDLSSRDTENIKLVTVNWKSYISLVFSNKNQKPCKKTLTLAVNRK